MTKLVSLILTAVVVMLAGVWACAPEPAPPKTLDIGVAAPISGRAAYMGNQIRNCAIMAIDDQNERGGVTIAGETYTLNAIVRDTKLDAAVGKAVGEELVYDKKVKVIIGPFLHDVVGVQAVTEPNKVILLAATACIPAVLGPDKPYTFIFSNPEVKIVDGLYAYIHEFYPEVKTVCTIAPDQPDAPIFVDASKGSCQRYGFEYVGSEKFAVDTKDFMPIISRVLARNPDVIDTTTTASAMGGLVALLVKQLREVGYDGIIGLPTVPPSGLLEEQVPEEYLAKVMSGEHEIDSPIVPKTYWELYHRYEKTYGEAITGLAAQGYDVMKSFLEFLDGQDTMDTTVWMEGYAKYHWQSMYDRDKFWLGKPIWGINRRIVDPTFIAEFIDGKLETRWEAPMLYEVFVE